jgi:hypothetical protein
MWNRRKTFDFTETMLDAGYWMLDIPEFAGSEVQKHPVSRNQYPGSRNIANDFHQETLIARKHFMKLKGQLGSR